MQLLCHLDVDLVPFFDCHIVWPVINQILNEVRRLVHQIVVHFDFGLLRDRFGVTEGSPLLDQLSSPIVHSFEHFLAEVRGNVTLAGGHDGEALLREGLVLWRQVSLRALGKLLKSGSRGLVAVVFHINIILHLFLEMF